MKILYEDNTILICDAFQAVVKRLDFVEFLNVQIEVQVGNFMSGKNLFIIPVRAVVINNNQSDLKEILEKL